MSNLNRPVCGALCLVFACGVLTLTAGEDTPSAGGGLKKRWIHDDIETAYARSKATGKPMLVSFR